MYHTLHQFNTTLYNHRVVPVPLFSLFTGPELEAMVCGSPDIPLHLLRSVATYKVSSTTGLHRSVIG